MRRYTRCLHAKIANLRDWANIVLQLRKIPCSPPSVESLAPRRGARMVKINSVELLTELNALKAEYVRNRSIFIPGSTVSRLAEALGAKRMDLQGLRDSCSNLPNDPTLAFRKSANGRFSLDCDRRRIERLEHQPYILSTAEDFIRHDSGELRRFSEIDENLQKSPALHALMLLKFFMIDGVSVAPRPMLDYESSKWVCTLFSLRTVTTPDLMGEPALEGVHSDGVDHTMTVYIGSQNMTADSATTFLHAPQQESGTRWDEVDSSLTLESFQHREFLDTVIFIDYERKHSVSSVLPIDHQKRSTRDMLLFFTRKPAIKGHVAFPYDSFVCHEARPLSVAADLL
ncbi:2OG-Fe dioxygenase family protein [Streptomyces sp. NPDC056534]|uniref:2OG-Fe dioxygenase family protein n=1 Tax=Streptomyces sp. NPDC056534 TaxID=3345857 RepID=UPI003694497B